MTDACTLTLDAPPMPASRPPACLDNPPDEAADRLTRLARRLFGVPVALVQLVRAGPGRASSVQGLVGTEVARHLDFCRHVTVGDELRLVPDARLDERLQDHPLVTGEAGVRFVAGCPLTLRHGCRVGSLYLIDVEPRTMDAEDLTLLRDLARLAEQEIAAAQLTTVDELTLLPNRRGFLDLGRHALGQCTRVERPVQLHCLALDGLGQINERFGRAAGDRALVAFARLLMQNFRESDVVGRLGGDRFAVLVTHCGEGAGEAAWARLRHALDRYKRESRPGHALDYRVAELNFEPVRHSTVEAMLADATALLERQTRGGRAA